VSRLLVVVLVLFSVFLLAGGVSALQAYTSGAKTYSQYVTATLAPLFGGFVLMGAFGLVYAYKNRQSRFCLVGFGIALFCYFALEGLFSVLGGP